MSSKKSLNKTIKQVWEQRYVVPLYQRNFAWAEDEIEQLLQDIYDHSPLAGGDIDSNYYLGSLVLLQRRDGSWEVIDGQQRLTTLHIICRYIGILSSPRLTFDSRPEVERFFADLFHSYIKSMIKSNIQSENGKIVNLVEALRIVEEYKIRKSETEMVALSELGVKELNCFKDFIQNNVILVCTPLPEDTDVAAYFEIMNNRGEQLQNHEILKALLMPSLNKNDRELFAMIWDACSQMDRPIQQTLLKLRGKGVFGDNYDTLVLDKLKDEEYDDKVNKAHQYDDKKEWFDLDEIIYNKDLSNEKTKTENNEEEDIKYRSIIDFPNFLMHVLRIYSQNDIPLNSDNLPVEKPGYIKDPMEFIKTLLKVRVLFDRYVVKVQGDDDNDNADFKWRLLRPYKYTNDDRNYLKLKNTFTESQRESTDNEEIEDGHNRIVKIQSMLQVTFRQRKYKEWLYSLLSWLYKESQSIDDIKESDLLSELESWTLNYYNSLPREIGTDKKPLLAAGVETPHFLFNFIDYLYWLASNKNQPNVKYINGIVDFQFSYYNSVEHHLPQSYSEKAEIKDLIGNLCLISRRKNSNLNDKGPKEKAKIENGMQPKRLIMYKITAEKRDWGRFEIEDHQNEIVNLLNEIPNLLSIKCDAKE